MSLERYEPGEIEPVLDAELVDDEQPRPVRRVVDARVVRSTHRVVTHHRTRTAARATGRQVSYVLAGAVLLGKRAVDARTNSFHNRMLRAAEASKDWERIGEWEARSEHAKRARHERRMDWLEAPVKLVRAAAVGVVSLAVLLVAIGVVAMAGSRDVSAFLEPFVFVFGVAQWVATAVAVAWTPLVVALPWLLLVVCWQVGRKAGAAPAWLQTAGQAPEEQPVDERAIAHALQHLGIAPLSRFFKDGGVLAYVAIPARDGLGVAASVRLPSGVSAADVIGRKDKLAANLGRATVETWPSTGDEAGILDLWVANRGALEGGAGDWPLLEQDQAVDVLDGVPVGITLRGTSVMAPVDGTSWLIGGRPGQGKSNFARLLVMGTCLDPTAEVWCYVLADNADFDPLAGRFTRYEVGMGDDVAEAALGALTELLGEIERRGRVMRERGAKTAAEAGFHELVIVLDECHRLFQHREHGAEAARIGEDLVKQARKYGVVLMLVTQSPTATSIPKGITREVVCRVAFSCVDQVGNDALLGTGRHTNGVRATELRPGSRTSPGDRGKCITVGVVPDTDWSLVLAHRVEGGDVAAVAERALRLRHAHGVRSTAVSEPRDLLDDLTAVLSDAPVPAADVPALLREYAPDAAVYRAMTGKQLRDRLGRLGVKVPSTGNRYPVDPDAVRAAIAGQDGDAS